MDAKLVSVVVPCRRFAETAVFYRRLLHLNPFEEGPSHCFFWVGGAFLALHVAGSDETQPTGHGLFLNFSLTHWDEVMARLAEAKVVILQQERTENGRVCLIADPEGNRLELLEDRSPANQENPADDLFGFEG